ncbi:MAG: CRISPR-associated protein Cas4 [bacterium]
MNLFETNEYKITGTLVNYYIHCKRQCWLFGNKINMEDNSELVKIGRALHEEKETQEIQIDNIKIDKISDEYLTEIKKSDADLEACRYQLLFYLKKLKNKGIIRKGKLEILEKVKTSKKTHIFELNEKNEDELKNIESEIKQLIFSETVPSVEKSKKCNKCAYNSYCNI